MNKKEELIKGFYSLFDTHSKDNDLNKHSKKGSDIKVNLGNISTNLSTQKAECLKKMNEGTSGMSFYPDADSYYDKEYKHLLDYIPKKFSYDLIRNGKKYIKTDNDIQEPAMLAPTEEEKVKMRSYNEHAEKYIRVCIDKIKIDSLRRNIQDNKNYTLTTNQITLLGF